MLKVLDSEQSNLLDTLSIENKIISESELIDNAGKAIAYHIIENIEDPFNKSFLSIAGIGKNGLDAIAANYYLNLNNIHSELLIIDSDKVKLKYVDKYISKKKIYTMKNINSVEDFDWIIEGIFGTGLNKDIKGDFLQVMESLSSIKNVLSIDIPSGIYSSKGASSNIHINAKETISFTYPKVGHFLSKGYAATGDLFTYPIGHSTTDINTKINLIDRSDVLDILKPLDPSINKYIKGKVLSLSGSSQYTGAALLSGMGAIYSGTGLLKQIVPTSLHSIFSTNKESIDILLNDNRKGFLSMDNYKEIEDLFDWPDCFIIGPGLSPCKESVKLIEEILENFTGNCVLDASGFLSLSDFNEFGFSKLPQKTILTPHYGELSKILNISNNELRDNTIEILIDISKKLEDRILVLKGPNTIIINGNSEIRILSNGNQLLSTAGTGDVLTGMISAYVAAGYSLEESAIVASYIHAECSNFFLKEGHENISTSQIIDLIPKVQFRLRANYDT